MVKLFFYNKKVQWQDHAHPPLQFNRLLRFQREPRVLTIM